jgi:hypothetical protein
MAMEVSEEEAGPSGVLRSLCIMLEAGQSMTYVRCQNYKHAI